MKSGEQLPKQEEIVRPLLDYLTRGVHQADGQWEGWQITRIVGGFNNLLYRATDSWGDLAIKFSIRDKRDRASREYSALLALHQADLMTHPTYMMVPPSRWDWVTDTYCSLVGDITVGIRIRVYFEIMLV